MSNINYTEQHERQMEVLVGDFMTKNGWKITSIDETDTVTKSVWKHPILEKIILTINKTNDTV